MPISYQTPEPFAPGISSAYGAAQQWSQDAPGIISANNSANQLQSQNTERADRMRFAYAQANAESQDRQAQRYFQSDAANADRQQGAFNLGAQLTQRNDEASMEAQARMDMQRQGAELSNWLGQQDLSQKEVLRLQQQKAAIADVQASNLSPEMQEAALMKLKTGIDPLEQRMKMQQAKMIDQHGQLYEMQLKQEAQRTEMMAKVNNMTAGQRIHYEVPQAISDQIEDEVNRQGNLTPQERDQKIQQMKRRVPGAQQFVIDPTGKLTPIDQPKNDKMPEFKAKDAQTMAEIQADSDFPPTVGLDGKETKSPEWYKRRAELMKGALAEHEQMNGIQRPTPPAPRNEAKEAAKAKILETEKPFVIGEGTKEQNDAVKWMGDTRANVSRVPGLPPQAVEMFTKQADTGIKLLSQYGSIHAMPPEVQQLFEAIQTSLIKIGEKIPEHKEPEKKERASIIDLSPDPATAFTPGNGNTFMTRRRTWGDFRGGLERLNPFN